ncbi:hypothetical protein ACTXT7_000599 [Hymenolepis weldensis]
MPIRKEVTVLNNIIPKTFGRETWVEEVGISLEKHELVTSKSFDFKEKVHLELIQNSLPSPEL